MQLGLDLRSPDLSLIANCTMYLGAASFHIFDSEIDEECPEFPGYIDTQFLGYDCWAFIGHLNVDGSCVGAFILPFGPWTMDRAEVVDRLDKTPQGAAVNLPELLALFPQPMRVTETFTASEGIIVASFDELELPAEADEAVTFDLKGDLTMIAFADGEDWVDGPVLILRSELVVSGNHSDLGSLDETSHEPGKSGVTDEARARPRGAGKAQTKAAHRPFPLDSQQSSEGFQSPNGGLMGSVDFATLDDSSRIAEMTGLPLSDVASAIEGDASAQNSVGYALLESSDIELGLAFLAASAHQGVPWALGSYTWFCIKTEQFERARDLFAVSAHACEMFVAVNSDDYESFEFLQTEWVNCRNNEALCALATNEDPSWALAVWAEGADTGHPESNFYPALVNWKLGEEQQAIEHLEGLDSELLEEMRQIMTDGSSSAMGWFSLWCDEGIALLDRYESSHGSLPSIPPASNRFCTECGAERQVEHKFCGVCGTKFSG